MQPVELVGLVISVAFAGLAIGVAVTLLIAVRKDRSAELHIRRTDAYAQWLAAWTTLTRASRSFVAAFRALAAEDQDSKYYALRQDEAQRSRSAWYEATRDLDRAEAALVAWSPDPEIRTKLADFEIIPAETLRTAVNGGTKEMEKLVQRLQSLDERAAEFVRASTGGASRTPSLALEQLRRVIRFASSIMDNWDK